MAKYSAATADRRTPSVLKRVFFLLLQDEGVNEDEILRDFHVDLASRGEADRRVIREASDKMRDLINATNELSVGFNLRDLQQQRWDISSANVHSEFLKVADVTFEDDQNWGRAVGLVSFAVAYAIYADSQRMHGIMPSTCAWTGHVFDGKLKVFMQDSGGWVSVCTPSLSQHSKDPTPIH